MGRVAFASIVCCIACFIPLATSMLGNFPHHRLAAVFMGVLALSLAAFMGLAAGSVPIRATWLAVALEQPRAGVVTKAGVTALRCCSSCCHSTMSACREWLGTPMVATGAVDGTTHGATRDAVHGVTHRVWHTVHHAMENMVRHIL